MLISSELRDQTFLLKCSRKSTSVVNLTSKFSNIMSLALKKIM